MATQNTSEDTTVKTDKKKAKKPKGPIRTGVVIPTLIFVGLVWAYFFFFFDAHVRHALEYVATQGNGAEVNIGRLRTSFWSASMEIDNVQVTDGLAPAKNKIQIGKIRWGMLWDALLRGKIVIDDASILEVALGAPRKTPGYVIPPPPPPPPGQESQFDKLKKQALDKAQEEFNKNVLGDVAALLGGADPAEELKKVQGQLKSSARVKELETELKKKEKEWKDRLEKLPQAKDIQALQAKIKGVKLDGFSNPAEVQTSIQQLDAIFKEADAKVKEVQGTANALNGDVGGYQKQLNDLQAMVQQDIKDLENRIKLPSIDVQTLSRMLFGPMLLTRVHQAEAYMNKARQYMPPKKTKEEKAAFKAPIAHERSKGRNYKFGRPNAYPLFWLRKAQISSKAIEGADYSGNLTGTLTDVTDDPPIIGKPTIAKFEGEFPKQEMFGIIGAVTIDHVTEVPMERLDLKIAKFAVEGQKLVNSPDVQLGFDKAHGSTNFEAQLKGNEILLSTKSEFAKAAAAAEKAAAGAPGSFLVADAKQPILADILKGAMKDIPKVSLNASVTGAWTDPKFAIDTSLARDLAAAFDKQIQAKIAEAKTKLKAFIDGQVNAEKEKLMAEFNKAKGQIDALIKSKEEEINKAKGTIETAKNEAIKNQQKKLEGEGKKALEDLKKQFKF